MRLGKARPEGVEISGPVYRLGLHFNGTYTARHEIGRIVRRKYDDGTGSNRYAYYQVNRKRQAKRRGVVAKVFGDCLRLRDRLTVKLVRTKGAKLSPGAKLAKRRADRAERRRAERNDIASLARRREQSREYARLAREDPAKLARMYDAIRRYNSKLKALGLKRGDRLRDLESRQ